MITNTKKSSNFIKLLLCAVLLFSISCKHKPEFYKNGKGYYTSERCVKDTTYTEWCYHYGYNFFRGKYEFHWGNDRKYECLEYVTDTVEIK